ncbi:hypothetical protein ACFLYB_06240 [Chloroflexota bacterium]
MKTRILAIVLSLALLSSLFVFAAPVSARTVSNANDNAGFFEFTLYFTRVPVPPDTSNYTAVWQGNPTEFEGKNIPGTLRIQGEAVYQYDISGYFGEGNGLFHWNRTMNFKTGRAVGFTVWECFWDNDDWEGSLTFIRSVKQQWVAWDDPEDLGDLGFELETIFRTMTLVNGTGDFENFNFQKKATVEPIPSGEILPQLTAWGKFAGGD